MYVSTASASLRPFNRCSPDRNVFRAPSGLTNRALTSSYDLHGPCFKTGGACVGSSGCTISRLSFTRSAKDKGRPQLFHSKTRKVTLHRSATVLVPYCTNDRYATFPECTRGSAEYTVPTCSVTTAGPLRSPTTIGIIILAQRHMFNDVHQTVFIPSRPY